VGKARRVGNMSRLEGSFLGLLFQRYCTAFILVVIPVILWSWYSGLFPGLEKFTLTEVATITQDDRVFYVVPDKLLKSGVMFTTSNGKRHYVLSEEKLRLLGSEFLSTLSKGIDE